MTGRPDTPSTGPVEGPPLSARMLALAERHRLVESTVVCEEHSFPILHVADTNALLDSIRPEDFARDERLPYWAEVWTSAVALAGWSLRERPFEEREVVELGCGVGLAGIAAARSGATVLLTDYEEDALAFARWNAERNGCGGATEFLHLDWRRPDFPKRFPWIIGADIAYERQNFLPLLETCEVLLAPGGEIVLADPNRQTAGPFLALAAEWGYERVTTPVHLLHRGQHAEVSIHRLRRTAEGGCRG
jgi:predicted nicotinamide N-methyase